MGLLYDPKVQQSQTTAPAYALPYTQRALGRAESATLEGYIPYTGDLSAGFSPLEAGGANVLAGAQMGTNPYTQASDMFSQAGQGLGSLANTQWGQPQAEQYMNPYQQNVIDITKREAETDFQKQQAALRGRLGAAGAFGGSRATLLETEGQRAQNQRMDDIQMKGLADAYNNAQNIYLQDKAGQQAGFQGMGQIGQGLGNLAQNYTGQMQDFGLQQRQQQQDALDREYARFQEERDFPLKREAQFANILGGLTGGQSMTSSTESGGPTDLARFIGLLTSGVGAINDFKLT